jgi:hypothetical protein
MKCFTNGKNIADSNTQCPNASWKGVSNKKYTFGSFPIIGPS